MNSDLSVIKNSLIFIIILISGCSNEIVFYCDGNQKGSKTYIISKDLTRVDEDILINADRGLQITRTYWKRNENKIKGYIQYGRDGSDSFIVYSYKDEKITSTYSMSTLPSTSNPYWDSCKK